MHRCHNHTASIICRGSGGALRPQRGARGAEPARSLIPIWSAAELGLSAGVPAIRIAGRVPPPPRPAGEILTAVDAAERVRTLVNKLVDSQVI
jgi:hypothetical protein